jgi:hypothetical protein
MVALNNSRGIGTLISTNLNVAGGLEEMMAAGPSQVMVSASGFGDSYELTHRGGRWPVFLANLRLLAELKKKMDPGPEVEVYYHIYKDRTQVGGDISLFSDEQLQPSGPSAAYGPIRGDDFQTMRALCRELDLPLRPTWACLLPLDNLHNLARGRPVSREAEMVMDLQPLPARPLLAQVSREPLSPCGLTNILGISPELSVPACSCWFDPRLEPLTADFLATPLEVIKKARAESELCRLCQADRLHHCYLTWHEKGLEWAQGLEN